MGSATASRPSLPASLWEVVKQVSARFSRDGCSLMAAAIAFFGLISLVPLGALAISVCGRVLGSSAAAEQQVTGLLRSSLPLSAPGLEQAIRQFTHPTGRWLVELISALGLLWAGSRLFLTLEDVLTRVWSGHGRGRPLLLRNLIAFAATLAAGLIFLAITLVTTAAAALASRAALLQELPQYLHPAPWLRAVGAPVAAWLMFLLTYKFLPQARARWPEAAIGAAAAAVLWEVCRLAFAALLARSATYGHLYGSLAGAVVVSVWIYLSASIMLLGAELAVVLEHSGTGLPGQGSQPADGGADFQSARSADLAPRPGQSAHSGADLQSANRRQPEEKSAMLWKRRQWRRLGSPPRAVCA